MSPVLGKKTLQELHYWLSRVNAAQNAVFITYETIAPYVKAIEDALKPKRSAKPAAKRRLAKKKAHKDEIGAIREAVRVRAGGKCEACAIERPSMEIDHFFGGSNRRALQSIETCWQLDIDCHRLKTRNYPSATAWLLSFENHAEKYGYVKAASLARARLESLQIQQKAGMR